MDEGQPLTDAEVPSTTPNPPIRIQLYDGQQITGRLHPRWQGSTGSWFYRVSVTLWASTQLGARGAPEPADVEFDAPQTHARPIDGVSYQGVPLTRHWDAIIRARTGRRLPEPAPGTRHGRRRDDMGRGAGAAGLGPRRTHEHTEDCPIFKEPFHLTTEPAAPA